MLGVTLLWSEITSSDCNISMPPPPHLSLSVLGPETRDSRMFRQRRNTEFGSSHALFKTHYCQDGPTLMSSANPNLPHSIKCDLGLRSNIQSWGDTVKLYHKIYVGKGHPRLALLKAAI